MRQYLRSQGLVRLYSDEPGAPVGSGRLVAERRNQLVFSGLDLMARCLAGLGGGLDGLYLEYVNGVDPASVLPSALDPRVGVEHYTGLSGDRDYLRVPLQHDGRLEASDSRYQGNRIRFFGASGGAQGVKGLPFSHLAGSVVYGAALVQLGATPPDDLVYARIYLGDLEVLAANRQVGLSWALTLLHPDDV